MHAFIRLPKYFKSKLNLTGRRLRRGDQSGVADRTPRRIKDISIVEWRSEIRAVENIEEFRSKLHIEGVGNSFDVIVLEYAKIEIQQSRTNHSVAAKIASQVDRIRYCKPWC